LTPSRLSAVFTNTQRTQECKQEQALEIINSYIAYHKRLSSIIKKEKQIFEGAVDHATKLATFGFGQAKFQDNDVREFAAKALGNAYQPQAFGEIMG
jgi:hypothetical protein